MESPAVSSQQGLAGDREVFRGAGSVVLWWVWVLIAIGTLIDLAVQGRDHSAVVMAALVTAITGAVYGCALRPRIVADAGGITVENPLRDHHAPWGVVDKVDTVYAVRVHCAPGPGASKGKIFHSWAMQSSPRSARAGQRRGRRSMTQEAGGPAGYGRYPGQAQEALRRTPAEFAAHQLDLDRGDGGAAACAHHRRARLVQLTQVSNEDLSAGSPGPENPSCPVLSSGQVPLPWCQGSRPD
jgi:hypothetical protein